MAQVFFTLDDGSPRALMGLRRQGDGTVQSPAQAVPDGDTAGVQLDGTGSVRFLGVDSPEKSFEQPLGGTQSLAESKWEQYLTHPFANGYPVALLEPALAHLAARFGAGAAANHHRHAVVAGDTLRALISAARASWSRPPARSNSACLPRQIRSASRPSRSAISVAPSCPVEP